MEFRFPGWGMSLKEKGRAGAQALAAPAAQHSAWRRDDLDDLSGDEVWHLHRAPVPWPLLHCSALPSESARACTSLRLGCAPDSLLCCSQEDAASAPSPDAAQARSLQARRDAAADSGAAAAPPSPCASGEQPGKRGGAAAAARITDLPDAVLRKVLCLLTQRAALPAALACSALRQACLSDEVWSAWSAGAPHPCAGTDSLCWRRRASTGYRHVCADIRTLSVHASAACLPEVQQEADAGASAPQAMQPLVRSQSAPSPPDRARTRRARPRQARASAAVPLGRRRCPPR